jgi:hypothetical protein
MTSKDDDGGNRTIRITADGRVYRKGKKYYTNRDTYEGEFLDGMRHGKGTYLYINGDRYQVHSLFPSV